MKPIIYALLLSAFLSGCSDRAEEYTPGVVPDGLKDCRFFRVLANGADMRIVRCPNSSTTSRHSCGKGCTRSDTVVER